MRSPPAEFPADRGYDRVVAISRSGTTTEVLRAIEAARAPVTMLTAVGDSPLAVAADAPVVLDFADEESVVQTVFATTALMLLRASLGEDARRRHRPARAVLAKDGQAVRPGRTGRAVHVPRRRMGVRRRAGGCV